MKFLGKCLSSIVRYADVSRHRFQVCVVDNASADGSQKYIRSQFPDIYLIENPENLGFAKANNVAIRRCQSRYILLVNNDVELISNVIDEMISFMDSNTNVGVTGCQLVDRQNSLQQSYGHFHTFKKEREELLVSIFHPLLRKRSGPVSCIGTSGTCEVDYISGAFFLIRETVIRKVGMLDEDYFFYSEEMDFCYRVKQQTDYKILLMPHLKVIHYGGGSSSAQNKYKYDLQLLKSKLHFAKKVYSKKQLVAYRILSLLSIGVRLVRKLIKGITHSERFELSQWEFYRESFLLYLK